MSKTICEGGEVDNCFHRILPLSQESGKGWDLLSERAPLLPRGWYELSRFPQADRVEFTRAFWQAQLGPHLSGARQEGRFAAFLDQLEDVEIVLTQPKADYPLEAHMLYTLKGREGALGMYGAPPATPAAVAHLRQQFAHLSLPDAYFSFLTIHDGFNRYLDRGIVKIHEMARIFQSVQQHLAYTVLNASDGVEREAIHTVPFYEGIEVGSYHCFDAAPGQEQERGNYALPLKVGNDRYEVVSSPVEKIFSTFIEWLLYYLEDREKIFTRS